MEDYLLRLRATRIAYSSDNMLPAWHNKHWQFGRSLWYGYQQHRQTFVNRMRAGRQEPAAERFEGPVGLVDRRGAEAPLPKSGEKPRHCSRVECREVVNVST